MRCFLVLTLFWWANILARCAGAEPNLSGIDFSYAGYGGGGVEVPFVPAVLLVRPTGADDTALLQAALDRLASLPLQNGFRGALQLSEGTFQVSGQLRVRTSGVVMRGAGEDIARTVILATGLDRRTLIEIGNNTPPSVGRSSDITDESSAVGTQKLHLRNASDFSIGRHVVITRPSTKEWISALGMDKIDGTYAELRLHWLPGSRDLVWDRIITRIEPSLDSTEVVVTLDAPITAALERRFGGGSIAPVSLETEIVGVGLENLVLESAFDQKNLCDEEHAWIAVSLGTVRDAWVRNVTSRHFVESAVWVGQRARRVTIDRCRSEAPVSELGGFRRQSFFIEGQQILVSNCTAYSGLNDFASGLCVAGPNVFLNCTAIHALGPSGAFESCAYGVLYDNVNVPDAGLRLTYDLVRTQAAGWTSANCVIWNCRAKVIEARGPEGANNVALSGDLPWYSSQLDKRGVLRSKSTDGILFVHGKVKEFTTPPISPVRSARPETLQIKNGRFVIANKAVWGGELNEAWWKGQTAPKVSPDSGASVTRWVPGRTGPGLTEDLSALAERMRREGMPFFQGGPGLWYDRRRDEHSIIPRQDGNVWAPFYEMPWARSGKERAWDGLSKFDLTKYNPWYFSRTKGFTRLCAEQGLVHYHNLYNTHNVLEIEPHWIDYPWRPANCINETGLPEPPPAETNNRLHLANEFYNVKNSKLLALHRAYIVHSLDELGDAPNIIFGVAFQFAGPLAFQEFFLDTVAEWEKRTGKRVRIALTTSKETTDAILADPTRCAEISVIDMRYWQYRPDGSLWAPAAGTNRAFRESITAKFGKSSDTPPPTTAEEAYRQVREYRDRFPDKAIVAWNNGVGQIPAIMAGAAQVLMRNPASGQSQGQDSDATPFDGFVREELLPFLAAMSPHDGGLGDAQKNWMLMTPDKNVALIYSLSGKLIPITDEISSREKTGLWYNPRTSKTVSADEQILLKKGKVIAKPTEEAWLLLLK